MGSASEYPPRFHQSTAIEFQRYLGDKVKLRCYAVGRPKPTVHWMRYGKPVEIRLHDDHLKENTKHMTLDIKRVQAEDAVGLGADRSQSNLIHSYKLRHLTHFHSLKFDGIYKVYFEAVFLKVFNHEYVKESGEVRFLV